MVFGVQKGVFTLQKYGFCIAKVGILCMLLCHSKLQVYVLHTILWYLHIRKQAQNNNQLATFWQTVSSRRGPIYRARTHEHPPNGVAIRNISCIKTDRKKREANP